MKTIELFSGTKSFSKVAAGIYGMSTWTFDMNPDLEPDTTMDIRKVPMKLFKVLSPDILWASPPCTAFSVASIGTHWTGGRNAYIPKTQVAKDAQELVKHTLRIIKYVKPRWWFIENPRGILRKMSFMQGLHRITVTYCQYGDTRMKPTDIWTNAVWWVPRPVCKNGNVCHESAPRGSKTGTQGINTARDRGIIPPGLFEDIFSQVPF